MEERIKEIMADVFLLNVEEIEANASQDSIEAWDSIGHLNFITALEEEFDLMFDEDQIVEMLNLQLVIEITKEAIDAK